MCNVSRMLLWRFLQIGHIGNLCTVWLCMLHWAASPCPQLKHGPWQPLQPVTTPARQDALHREHAVTSAVSWTSEAVHTEIHTDKQFSKKDELLLSWSLGVNLAFYQTGTSISPLIICKGSFHGICKISLFLSFPLKKVSVTQTLQSSQLDAHVGCPVGSPLS